MFCLGLDDASFFFLTCHMLHPSHPPQFDHSKQCLVRSTNHECPHYTIFIILILLLIVPNILPSTILIYALSKTDSMKAVWLRHLAASLMVWRPKLIPGQPKLDLWQTQYNWDRIFSGYFSIPINIIPSMLHIHAFIHLSQTLYSLSNWQHTGPQSTGQFHAFNETGRFITMFTWPCHWSPLTARWIQSMPYHPIPYNKF